MHPCDRCAFKIQSKIRVQIIIRIIRVIRVQKNLVFKPPVSAPPRTKIREIRAIRVQKNIRDIRFITSLRSVGLRRISCSKKTQSDIRVQKSRVPHVSALLNYK